MAGFDARFWELPFDPADLAQFPADLFAVEESRSPEGARLRRKVVDELRQVLNTRLTARQRQIVELYFFEGLTQHAVAEALGISQQAVSRQLFGVVRDGRKIGGAIQRLRKIAADEGWDLSEWV